MNSNSQGKTPLFIKIIHENTIKQGILEIPPGFVTEFGNGVPNRVILKVPNGKTWEVKMLKVGGKFWLGKGLVDFSEHYSLKKGHLLVFKYEGNSQFNVLIFDMTAMEIDYPGSSKDTKNKDTTAALIPDQQHVQEFRDNLASSSEVATNATNFTPSNPWFKITVKKITYLALPFSFIKKHMGCETKIIMLKVRDKAWQVKLKVYLSNKYASLYAGAPSFQKDNSLKEGDVCVFELISNNTFNVTINKI